MLDDPGALRDFLAECPPFDTLSSEELDRAIAAIERREMAPGDAIYRTGGTLPGLFVILAGKVEVFTHQGEPVSQRQAGECFGERGLMRDGRAPYDATCAEAGELAILPVAEFDRLLEETTDFAAFFGRVSRRDTGGARRAETDLSTLPVHALMTPDPISVGPDAPVREAAELMDRHGISCLLVTDTEGMLAGILTTGDLTGRVLARGLGADVPVREVMTATPKALSPEGVGFDAFLTMTEAHIGHLPVVERGRPVGIITRTNLLRHQALSSITLISEIARRDTPAQLAEATAQIPQLLAQMVGAGAEPHVITRLITDVGDAVTRRLIRLAEAELGPAPVPYLWAACGSQGRQEQTGVSDQDNCLIIDDRMEPGHATWFEALATRVCDGLDTCGYFYCPGDMMASNPRWRQPLAAWKRYFRGWIDKPDPTAQMLASVMFDLRAISGEARLLDELQAETLAAARKNSIFVAHMVSNSLKHTPPLGLFRGFALIRSGEHKDRLDLKHNGVVPVVDLGRIYALLGEIREAPTRARLIAARERQVVSRSGAHDLLDAYDFIAETRLRHQAEQIRAGRKPDNFMAPATLSELERSHLKDAFVVVKTMQAALGQGRQTVT